MLFLVRISFIGRVFYLNQNGDRRWIDVRVPHLSESLLFPGVCHLRNCNDNCKIQEHHWHPVYRTGRGCCVYSTGLRINQDFAVQEIQGREKKWVCPVKFLLLKPQFFIADLVTGIAVFFTCITISGLVYTFFIQSPVLKLEHILNSLTIMLALTEVAFGMLQIVMKCFRKNPYY